jgi:hypothetical protein
MPWTAPRTWVTGEIVTSTIMNAHVRDNFNALLPVGSFIYRAAISTNVLTAVEGRFLECNGVAVSRTTYAALFNYLNGLSTPLPYGAGDGSTTFNLPDGRGRHLVGHAAGGHASASTLGGSDGLALANRRADIDLGSNDVTDVYGGTPAVTNVAALTGVAPKGHLVGGVWFIKYTS